LTLADITLLTRLDELGDLRVFVVEDDLAHHARMLRWLEERSLIAVGMTAVTNLNEAQISGRDLNSGAVTVPLSEIGAAFLDFYFPEPPYDGAVLARALSLANVRSFAMSSVAEKNAAMIRAGALGGMRKREFASLLL